MPENKNAINNDRFGDRNIRAYPARQQSGLGPDIISKNIAIFLKIAVYKYSLPHFSDFVKP
jgi:hypothetical protein